MKEMRENELATRKRRREETGRLFTIKQSRKGKRNETRYIEEKKTKFKIEKNEKEERRKKRNK